MGLWGKITLTATLMFTAVTSAPQYVYNLVTDGKDTADRSLLEQLLDAANGGGPTLPAIPPEEIEIPIVIEQATIWDNLSAVLSDPLNILIIGFLIVGGAYLIRSISDRIFRRSA